MWVYIPTYGPTWTCETVTNHLQYFCLQVQGIVGNWGMVEMSVSSKNKEYKNDVFWQYMQRSSVILTTYCAIQRWHITVCEVNQHLREFWHSSTVVTQVIGQSGDARKQGWRYGVKPNGGEGVEAWGEGKVDVDERKGSDRFRREVAGEEWRYGSKKGNEGREPSRCSQHVCLLGWARGPQGGGTAAVILATKREEPVTNMLLRGTIWLAWAMSNFACSSSCEINSVRERKENDRKQGTVFWGITGQPDSVPGSLCLKFSFL